MVTFGDVHQQMSGKNSNWLSDIKQCIHYKEPDLDCTLVSMLQFMEKCLTKIRPGLLIEQYVKLFPTGYFVIVRYV